MILASASALPLFLVATSLNGGPIFFVATSWQFMQPLLFASASCAFAVPAAAMPTATTAANNDRFHQFGSLLGLCPVAEAPAASTADASPAHSTAY